MIRRRRVFYVEAYDSQGAAGYYSIFRRSWQRFSDVWQCRGSLGELKLDSELVAHWELEVAGPNWHVELYYEFLRLEHIISANIAETAIWQAHRVLAWTVDYLITGTIVRVWRASWRFALHLLYFQALFWLWLGLAIGGGWLAARAGANLAGLSNLVELGCGIAAGIACFAILRPLANRWHVVQINSCWLCVSALARGQASCFDAPIEAFAARIVACVCANEADEVVIVAHSAGGVIALAVIMRALELDPDFGRHGPQVVLLTLGSIMPGAALHPAATKMRDIVRRVASESSMTWIDCQTRRDVMNFNEFNPVGGIGVDVGAKLCNPLIWQVHFKEMVSHKYYRYLRRSFFRRHYQFIISGDRRASYDYLMLVAGPVAVAEWARHADDVLAAFAEDATFTGKSREPGAVSNAAAHG